MAVELNTLVTDVTNTFSKFLDFSSFIGVTLNPFSVYISNFLRFLSSAFFSLNSGLVVCLRLASSLVQVFTRSGKFYPCLCGLAYFKTEI